MSTWTRLVGDPILSKWIVVVLAISISLNGYLLKGIASGVVGGRFAESLGVGFGGVKGVVRFDETEEDNGVDKEEWEGQIVVVPPEMDRDLKLERRLSPEATRNVASFKMEEVDRKLQTASRLMIQPKVIIAPILPVDQPHTTTAVAQAALSLPSSSSSSPSSSPDDSSASISSGNKMEPIRTLDECIDIFENGPRPLSDSLALLNDEEIILLSQNGKVAAYALEKMLGPAELERAVRIRRALICTSFPFSFFVGFQNTDHPYLCSSRFTYSNFGIFRYPINQLRLFTCTRRMLRKRCRIHPSPTRNSRSSHHRWRTLSYPNGNSRRHPRSIHFSRL